MSEDSYSVVLVYSTSYALRAEKVLADAGIACKLIPVPRHLSSDCGVCVRVRRADREATRGALEAAGVEIEGVYDI
ncbi:MAG: DUF3343 domain-containing protein [Anaerolineae bacterium]|nr:DUF3343 domain-containing protein [Anaerolineae bacterium]